MTGPDYGSTNPEQLSARMYADEYSYRAQSRYGSPPRSRMMGNRRYDQYRTFGNADGLGPSLGDQQYAADPNQAYSRDDRRSHRRHPHNGECRNNGGGASSRSLGQYDQGEMYPGTLPQRFTTPGNRSQTPIGQPYNDRQYIEPPSLPLASPQASPQAFRQRPRSLSSNQSSYLNM